MGMIRITNPDELKPVHVVMILLFILAVAGNCLLTSAGKNRVLPYGAVDWNPDSPLLAIVEVLDLNYSQPTPNGVAIKALVAGTAAALGVIIAVVGLVAGARGADRAAETDTVIDLDELDAQQRSGRRAGKAHINPTYAAQGLLLALLAWSFASALWSPAPKFALGGSVLLAMQVTWAFALAYGMNRRAAVIAAHALLIVLVATAALAVLYHDERIPGLRASYPIGNPLFLAACLLPGVILLVSLFIGSGVVVAGKRPVRGIAAVILALMGLAVLGYAFYLTKSRGPAIGVGVSLAALAFFVGRRRIKTIAVSAAVVGLVVAGAFFFSQRYAPSVTGRSASMRVRFYAWDYAINLFSQRPTTGYGQGGYTLLADTFARDDVEADPQALEARISHAHNEWLEICADLGSVGVVLFLSAMLVTLHAAQRAVPQTASRWARWTLAALAAALAGLLVAEFFGVGLRIEGLPLIFYSVIGLIWAMARPESPRLQAALGRSRLLSAVVVVGAVVLCFVIADFAQRDFMAARSSAEAQSQAKANEWDHAVSLATRAYDDRLSVQRKFVALDNLIQTRLNAAAYLQARYVQRSQRAQEAGEPMRARLAAADRASSEAHLAAAAMLIDRLNTVAPGGFNTGWLEFAFRQTLAQYAAIDGDLEAAAQDREEAAAALARQIGRHPYDPVLAANYVNAASAALPPATILNLLARPLREKPVPSSYSVLLPQFGEDEQFQAIAGPIYEAAAEQVDVEDPDEWTDRWAPEKLRLGALTAFMANDYGKAVTYLQSAVTLYGRLGAEAPLARPTCYAELADGLYFADPGHPQPAIDTAEEALKLLPASQEGRALREGLAGRLVVYHLAAGHEDFARKILREHNRRLDADTFNRLVADRYVSMAYDNFNRIFRLIPDHMKQWSRRALELAPDEPGPWFLAADIAIYERNESQAIELIDKVVDHGGEPEDVAELLRRAVTAMPDSVAIAQLYRQIVGEPPPAVEPVAQPTTQP